MFEPSSLMKPVGRGTRRHKKPFDSWRGQWSLRPRCETSGRGSSGLRGSPVPTQPSRGLRGSPSPAQPSPAQLRPGARCLASRQPELYLGQSPPLYLGQYRAGSLPGERGCRHPLKGKGRTVGIIADARMLESPAGIVMDSAAASGKTIIWRKI